MKYINPVVISIYLCCVSLSCRQQQFDSFLSKKEMLKIVRKNDDLFSVGIKTKNAKLLGDIYSDSAQYVQPDRSILNGKDSIRTDWEYFILLKEKPVDLLLNIHDVRGNREIIYETGDGFTLLADSTKWKFNYVNVWRLQKDGSYKLEIDTYNGLK
jgi:ketosteroid isomerase-like protein